eukprot:Nk52_evm90s221 gene=Nk52_evmTU90s221
MGNKKGGAINSKGVTEKPLVSVKTKALPSSKISKKTIMLSKYVNKQKTLVFSTRGINQRSRHLMNDMRVLMPHSKSDVKLDSKDDLTTVNEVCELKYCNSCAFFEIRKRDDTYLWLSKVPNGPSCKFLVENVHTMNELKMTGNCLKGSRPFLSFDKKFDMDPHYALMKEMLLQVFGVPKGHPKSKPFFDRVMTFSIADNRIWVRNYQVVEEEQSKKQLETSLSEIGPRFCLNPIRIFSGSFCGATLYENPKYVSPNEHRRTLRQMNAGKYLAKKFKKDHHKAHTAALAYDSADDSDVSI